MTVAAELGLSEVGLERIDCIVAGSVPLSAPGDDPPMSADRPEVAVLGTGRMGWRLWRAGFEPTGDRSRVPTQGPANEEKRWRVL